ncbi:MAG: hypothetical protein ACI9LX_001248 [Paraglaciecola sp.]|jgi:hypothetical protein
MGVWLIFALSLCGWADLNPMCAFAINIQVADFKVFLVYRLTPEYSLLPTDNDQC